MKLRLSIDPFGICNMPFLYVNVIFTRIGVICLFFFMKLVLFLGKILAKRKPEVSPVREFYSS